MPVAKKILGRSDLAATTNTSVYTVPAGAQAACNINVCNRGAAAVTVRLALSDSGAPGNADWIEYDVSIPAKGVLERTGISLDTGKRVVAYASAATVSVVVHGQEQT